MALLGNPAVAPGSTVLVTGTNGFVGAHVADQLLHQGYKVRGAVRDAIKHQWLAQLFSQKYGAGKFELVAVKDMREPGAFDDAVLGTYPCARSSCSVTDQTSPSRRFCNCSCCFCEEYGCHTGRIAPYHRCGNAGLFTGCCQGAKRTAIRPNILFRCGPLHPRLSWNGHSVIR